MGFTLDKIVPWGRSYEEYVRMFDLSETDQRLRILGCGDGPASFNATLTEKGGNIVSFDPIYAFDTGQIRNRIAETSEKVMDQLRKNRTDYVWRDFPSVEALGHIRMSTMDTFLRDFEAGKREGRYIPGELPVLPFSNYEFDIALSSHFLFLYSAHLTKEFHLQSIQEMLRVAREVRIFPLLTLTGDPSPHLGFVTDHFSHHGFRVAPKRVPYEFQRGGTEMLAIKPA